jgi:hypothetical protein
MHRFMTSDLLPEYDSRQMADDGCPLTPGLAQWGDGDWRDTYGDWRDTFGECDTFGDDEPTNCLAPGFDDPP